LDYIDNFCFTHLQQWNFSPADLSPTGGRSEKIVIEHTVPDGIRLLLAFTLIGQLLVTAVTAWRLQKGLIEAEHQH
jgi:hypothetical protein